MSDSDTCRDFFDCAQTECPAYNLADSQCWSIPGTLCYEEDTSHPFRKIQRCLKCDFFRSKRSTEQMEEVCQIISRQFSRAFDTIESQDRELKRVSLEMAIGLSEVFEALKRISSGDPNVRISESSSLELIAKLKRMVNQTAENISEIVDLSHEFAIGLAEHFDVLKRVSRGDWEARVSGVSNVELLESLKEVTNGMIRSVADEITERIEAESQLRHSEERFRSFAEKAPVGITIMRPDRSFEYINPMFVDMFGYSIEDIPTKAAWFEKAFPGAEERERQAAQWEAFCSGPIENGRVVNQTVTVTCRDQGRKIVTLRTVALPDGKHFVAYTDVTQRVKAEQAIKASEERYRILIDNIQDGVFIAQDLRVRFVNDALARMVGYSAEEVVGKMFVELVAPDDRQEILENYLRIMAGERLPREMEFRMLHKDRRKRVIVNMHVGKLTLDDQVSSIGTVKDITERVLADQQRKKLEAKLQRSRKLEAIGTLAGGVAHDLNNILSGIVSYPELLLMDLPDESPIRGPVTTIKKSGEKAAAIVQDLLTLARRGVATTETVDFNRLVTDYLKSPEFESLCAFHPKVDVQTDLASDLKPISGSPFHLFKIVMNLVSNAVEAMPEGGTVSIVTGNAPADDSADPLRRSSTTTGWICLKVADTGVGIAKEDQERIFDPFYTKKVMGRSGTGLGMAVVWGTVEDHLGHIEIDSEEGRGTVFSVYLPASREGAAGGTRRPLIEDYMGDGQHILVVDDVAEQRLIASEMLKKLGYTVTTLSSGEAAIEFLQGQPVDLVVLDMIMAPGIDGLETFRRILRDHPRQKAIIASGFSETQRVRETQRLGAGEYVKKPYSIEKIGLAVHRELSRQQ